MNVSTTNVTNFCAEAEKANDQGLGGLWYVGMIMSICASIASNLGVNLQKFSMMREEKRDKQHQVGFLPISHIPSVTRWPHLPAFALLLDLSAFSSFPFVSSLTNRPSARLPC